ncbi:MAG: hypothetical protein K1X86_10390 [Ignavibacteria bacterium]|nr:hypothetical protein [Ignavibacteria bacterium]
MPKKLKERELEKGNRFFPHFSETFNSNDSKPYFSFKHLSNTHCISKCDKDEKSDFADTMYKLSQLTWIQIINSHRHGLGTEKIHQSSIKQPRPVSITEDVVFLAIRFSGMKPMVGFRRNATFYPIWFDRTFDVYDH